MKILKYLGFASLFVVVFACNINKNDKSTQQTNAINSDSVFQLSAYTALMDGKLEGIIPMSTVVKNGTHGLGTYAGLDGEVVIDNGIVYQVAHSGKIGIGSPDSLAPFAQVCFFKPDSAITFVNSPNLYRQLDSLLTDSTKIIAMKIVGLFKYVKTRSIAKQTPPYKTLTDIIKTQSVFEKEQVYGSMIGFRNPPRTKAINVPGYHMHFIADDKSVGGHLLQFEPDSVVVYFQLFDGLKNYR